jgi:hypothetical protein
MNYHEMFRGEIMVFPLNVRNEIQFDALGSSEDTKTQIINMFYHELVDSNVQDVIINDNSIRFKRGIFRIPGEHRTPFNSLSNGEITVRFIEQKLVVSYCFGFSHLFFSTLIMVLLSQFFFYITNSFKFEPLSFYLFSTIVGFPWLFGGSVLITLVRFKIMAHKFLKRLV